MLEKFARYPLTFGPSYIQPLERLSAYLGNAVRLYHYSCIFDGVF